MARQLTSSSSKRTAFEHKFNKPSFFSELKKKGVGIAEVLLNPKDRILGSKAQEGHIKKVPVEHLKKRLDWVNLDSLRLLHLSRGEVYEAINVYKDLAFAFEKALYDGNIQSPYSTYKALQTEETRRLARRNHLELQREVDGIEDLIRLDREGENTMPAPRSAAPPRNDRKRSHRSSSRARGDELTANFPLSVTFRDPRTDPKGLASTITSDKLILVSISALNRVVDQNPQIAMDDFFRHNNDFVRPDRKWELRKREADFVAYLRRYPGIQSSSSSVMSASSSAEASMAASDESYHPPRDSEASMSSSTTSLEPGSEPSMTSRSTTSISDPDDSAPASDLEEMKKKILPFAQVMLKSDSPASATSTKAPAPCERPPIDLIDLESVATAPKLAKETEKNDEIAPPSHLRTNVVTQPPAVVRRPSTPIPAPPGALAVPYPSGDVDELLKREDGEVEDLDYEMDDSILREND